MENTKEKKINHQTQANFHFLSILYGMVHTSHTHFTADESAVLACRGLLGNSGEHSPHDFLAVRMTVLVPGAVVVI